MRLEKNRKHAEELPSGAKTRKVFFRLNQKVKMDIQKKLDVHFYHASGKGHDKGKVPRTTSSGKVIAEYQEAPSEV